MTNHPAPQNELPESATVRQPFAPEPRWHCTCPSVIINGIGTSITRSDKCLVHCEVKQPPHPAAVTPTKEETCTCPANAFLPTQVSVSPFCKVHGASTSVRKRIDAFMESESKSAAVTTAEKDMNEARGIVAELSIVLTGEGDYSDTGIYSNRFSPDIRRSDVDGWLLETISAALSQSRKEGYRNGQNDQFEAEKATTEGSPLRDELITKARREGEIAERERVADILEKYKKESQKVIDDDGVNEHEQTAIDTCDNLLFYILENPF